MNIALWVLQVLLAAAFLAHGLLLLAPPPEIAVQMYASLPRWFWLFLGVAEVYGRGGAHASWSDADSTGAGDLGSRRDQ